jgi:N-acetyl-alpha-D-muramate 1-phosphate uridylyltransferase
MSKIPDVAMVLSAGRGTRMGVLSQTVPKPLTKVLGRTLLDRILVQLADVGVSRAVVNVHHLGDQITQHLGQRDQQLKIDISDEREQLLETGGGIKKALPKIGSKPFFAINSDALWVNEKSNALKKMAEFYDPEKMDILLLLTPLNTATGFDGAGDFFMDSGGQLSWRADALSAPYVYAGVQILRVNIFKDTPEGPWPLKDLYIRAAHAGRLYGCLLDGHWMHVGTKEAISLAEAKLLSLGEEQL